MLWAATLKGDHKFQITFLSQIVFMAAVMKTPVVIRIVNHYFSGSCAFALLCAFDIIFCLVCSISSVKSGFYCRASDFTCAFPLILHLRSTNVIKCDITIPVNLPILSWHVSFKAKREEPHLCEMWKHDCKIINLGQLVVRIQLKRFSNETCFYTWLRFPGVSLSVLRLL